MGILSPEKLLSLELSAFSLEVFRAMKFLKLEVLGALKFFLSRLEVSPRGWRFLPET